MKGVFLYHAETGKAVVARNDMERRPGKRWFLGES